MTIVSVIVVVAVMVVLEPKRVLLIDDTDESIQVNRPEKSICHVGGPDRTGPMRIHCIWVI